MKAVRVVDDLVDASDAVAGDLEGDAKPEARPLRQVEG